MRDVDRYVDRLYEATAQNLGFAVVKTEWHRYAADLNRTPDDIDQGSVIGAAHKAGAFSRGFHWVITTKNEKLMPGPIAKEAHQQLVQLVYDPFHRQVREAVSQLINASSINAVQSGSPKKQKKVYHLDVHSMPSLGTDQHRDPGERRVDIVISDCQGTSASAAFRDLVIAAYVTAGFKVGYNWPYLGGRVTELYGSPKNNHHTLQVELNRSLYMDEANHQWRPVEAEKVKSKIRQALEYVKKNIPLLPDEP